MHHYGTEGAYICTLMVLKVTIYARLWYCGRVYMHAYGTQGDSICVIMVLQASIYGWSFIFTEGVDQFRLRVSMKADSIILGKCNKCTKDHRVIPCQNVQF